jgi:hypothetical protein
MLTKRNQLRLRRSGNRLLWAVLLLMATTCWTGVARAQLPIPLSSQFDLVGFLEEATLDGGGTGAHQGGHLKVNGHVVTVPAETIVILPASALTWQELFAQAPSPYTAVATGMALADDLLLAAPLTTYEVHVVGNRVGNEYIAGLIHISQQDLNAGAGFINFIDYTLGEMRVGGTINANGTLNATNPGARVRINDPLGRFGRDNLASPSPDVRFSVDDQNPTIISATGFPMCLPRTNPATAVDPLCPETNRAKSAGVYLGTFTMADPATNPTSLDPRVQAPFEVGDFVNFAGTLVRDAAQPTTGPWPAAGTEGTYISAHTIVNNIAIYTAPGTDPAYVMIEVGLLGVGGVTQAGIGEAAIRTRFEGMTTDVNASVPAAQRNIHLYGIDVAPNGTTSDRDWGSIGVDPGPPLGAVKGRWRFRPPCTAVGTPTQKDCVGPAAGAFLPATREVRAVIEGLQSQVTTPQLSANGIIYGQYHAPIGEYIFPENVPGVPPPPNNFETMPFLACGGYTSAAGTLAGILSPWPGDAALLPVCAGAVTGPPKVTATATPSTVLPGQTVTLNATVSGLPPVTVAWLQTAGTTVTLNPAAANALTETFTAPASGTLTFQVTANNPVGPAATATVTVTVVGQTDTVVITVVEYRIGQQRLTVNATSTNPAAVLTLQPYISTTSGVPITVPGGTLTNNGGGLYSIVKVGVPQPNGAGVTVTSSAGGSATRTITRLRQ